MGSKAKIEKFETINKSKIKGKVGHTRTGACTAKGRCYHGWTDPTIRSGSTKKTKSKF